MKLQLFIKSQLAETKIKGAKQQTLVEASIIFEKNYY